MFSYKTDNLIDDNGAVCLAEALKVNKTLTSVSLGSLLVFLNV